jgi:hypothetical protein
MEQTELSVIRPEAERKVAAAPHGRRPDVSRWAQALSGREFLQLPPRPAVRKPAPSLPMVDIEQDRSAQREVIQLQPPNKTTPRR